MQVLDKGSIELLSHMGDDSTVVSSARVSYLGSTKGAEQDEKLIRYLLKNRHTSPFEQVEFQFLVKCPIFVARQWHRHRTWSYNEVSRRYTAENIEFYFPKELRAQSEDNKQMSAGILINANSYIGVMETHAVLSLNLYNRMIEAGIVREQARMILPMSMYTSFYAKTDLHNLFHFLSLRNHPHAQEEIRVYAQAIEELIKPIVPVSYKAWKELQQT